MGAAITACNIARRKHQDELLNAYHCNDCGMYHVGHMPKKVREAIDERRGV